MNIENPMVVDSLWRKRTQTDDYFDDVFDEEEEVEVYCASCGRRYLKEDAVPSQIWEDQYTCDEKECIEEHHTGWSESMELQKYYINRRVFDE